MPATHEKPIPSKITLNQHPVHPLLVVFPIAFLMSTLLTDGVFWWRREAIWALASFWLAAAGFTIGVLAALVGIADFAQIKQARRHVAGWSHMIAGVMALALAGANVQLRIDDPVGAVLPWGIFLSAVMAAIVSVTGWLGGTLTFRHGIGTYSHEGDAEEAAASEITDDAPDPG